MKIRRVGSRRHDGYTSIELGSSSYEWDSSRKVISFEDYNVNDFTSKSKHDYTVEFELSEVAEILDTIASDVISTSREHLIKELSPATVKILRILAVLAIAPEASEEG